MNKIFSMLAIFALLIACSNHNNDDKIQELEKKLQDQEKEMLMDKQNRLENELSEKNYELESLKNKKSSEAMQTFHALGYGAYPEASDHILTPRELRRYSAYELRIMRNEVFARYGYIFNSSDLKEYFNAQEWYRPLYSNVNNRLTQIEKINVEKIKEYE